jgi:hypothetical protein
MEESLLGCERRSSSRLQLPFDGLSAAISSRNVHGYRDAESAGCGEGVTRPPTSSRAREAASAPSDGRPALRGQKSAGRLTKDQPIRGLTFPESCGSSPRPRERTLGGVHRQRPEGLGWRRAQAAERPLTPG